MQTFLPYPDFKQSVKVLDFKRLGNQRREVASILTSIETGKGWIHHPAVKMWIGYTNALRLYGNYVIEEWVTRGYTNNMLPFSLGKEIVKYPCWLGDERLHSSHRANLLRKDFEWYRQFNWKEKPAEGYWWPKGGN